MSCGPDDRNPRMGEAASNMSDDDPCFGRPLHRFPGAQLQARLIDDVLDVSRIVSGKMRLARDPVEITTLLKDSLASVKPSSDAKQITLTSSFAPNLGSVVADAAGCSRCSGISSPTL